MSSKRLNEEWRLRVGLRRPDHAGLLASRLAADELKHDLSREFQDRVVASVSGGVIYLYCGTRTQAEGARRAIATDARSRGWEAVAELRRWHPIAEEWQDPDVPLPNGEASVHAERENLMRREREETESKGYPEFEVRARCDSHRDVMSLVAKLSDEGFPVVHRWKYLLVGATDEDSASEIADRIRTVAPEGAAVSVEGTWAAAGGVGRRSPFSVWVSPGSSRGRCEPEKQA